MTHPESEYLRELAGIEQLHEDRNWTADSALSSLPFADGANVTDPQARSKTGLRESSPLPNGFEGSGLQSIFPVKAHMRQECVAAECGWLPERPRTIAVARLNHQTLDEADIDDLTYFPSLLGAGGAVTIESAASGVPSSAITVPCHLHHPVSGGAWPRCRYAAYTAAQWACQL